MPNLAGHRANHLRAALAAATFALAVVASPSAAQETDAAADELAACLDETRASRGDPQNCVGAVADPCLDEASTTNDMVGCLSTEHGGWDALLNAAYADALGRLNDAGRIALRDAQRAWIPFRDAACDIYDAVYEGGSIARVERAGCHRTLTARRALDLRAIAERPN